MTTKIIRYKNPVDRLLQEISQQQRERIERTDPMPKEDGAALWAWYKRQERRHYRNAGYVRLDVMLSPRLYEKLKPHLMPYCHGGNPPRGSELVQFLKDLEIYD